MKNLHNCIDKNVLKEQAKKNHWNNRRTCSFYRYVELENVPRLRDELYLALDKIGVLGRIYLAKEGINAQISYPKQSKNLLLAVLEQFSLFSGVRLNESIEEPSFSFCKLVIKVREKIVADGLNENDFDLANVGQKVKAKEFNELVEDERETILLDVRNHYETEVGRMRQAVLFDGETFRELLPQMKEYLEKSNSREKNVVMYCTGGIRCEKASAYLIKNGFKRVFMLDGGIVNYVHQTKKENLANHFVGKNFVFDERLGERVSEEIIAFCHQCGTPCDDHDNCRNDDCHLLFIQCRNCREKMNGCCSENCKKISLLPIEEQRALRRGKPKKACQNVYRKTWKKSLEIS